MIGGLLVDEPDLEADVAFGCAATILLEDRLADHIREAWDQARSAMRRPLADRRPARQETIAAAVR